MVSELPGVISPSSGSSITKCRFFLSSGSLKEYNLSWKLYEGKTEASSCGKPPGLEIWAFLH